MSEHDEPSTMAVLPNASEQAKAANGNGAADTADADGSLNNTNGEGAASSSSIRFTDHFSLRGPSGTVRLRNNNKMRIYDQTTSQVIIEERHSAQAPAETEIMVKRSDNSSFGQLTLRFWYALVATFFSGFLFIFCFQVVLFIFLNLTVEAGATVQQPKPNYGAFVSNVFALPVFVHGFSTAMSIAVASLHSPLAKSRAPRQSATHLSVVLENLGSLDAFDAKSSLGKRKKMVSKARLNEIISTIARGKSRQVFAFMFSTLIVALIFITVGALNMYSNESTGATLDLEDLLSDFEYAPQPDLPYPTCRLKKGIDISGDTAALSDFVYVAGTTYYNQRQDMLDAWFGEGVAEDEMDVVLAFKEANHEDIASAAMFLYSFPDNPGFGTIAIRGTQSSWDLLANARLWSAALFAQGLRFLLPFGEVWTPILDDLVWLVTLMDSRGMAKVGYYAEVSAFANYLLDSGNYTSLAIVGHSLGGGIALISGAQTGLASIGISAPNALLSRHTFGITEQALKTHTFNVIPNRDPVPMIDDVSDLFQRIECRTEPNDFFGCHDAGRTLCELQYMCGSGDRPVLCSCVEKFGYPKPTQLGNRTFEEACIEQSYVVDKTSTTPTDDEAETVP